MVLHRYKYNIECGLSVYLMKNLLDVKCFGMAILSKASKRFLRRCVTEMWSLKFLHGYVTSSWGPYDVIMRSLWRHHQLLRRYLYNTLERMSTKREQIDLDHVLVNGDRRDWSDEIIKSTMPAACKSISNTKYKRYISSFSKFWGSDGLVRWIYWVDFRVGLVVIKLLRW